MGGLRQVVRRFVAALDGDALRSSLEALCVALGDAAPAAEPVRRQDTSFRENDSR